MYSYLDLMETAVAAYPGQEIARAVAGIETEGVKEHGIPRLAANMGVLLANGRLTGRIETFRRMMSACCRDAAKGKMPLASSGNEFSVKELVLALLAVERAGLFPKDVTDAWRTDISRIDPLRCYTCLPPIGAGRAFNWCVFGAASEQARIAAGVGGDPGFVERCVSDQLRWFDANGMYRDPCQPAVYDFVTRLQFMSLLQDGYHGPSADALLDMLDRAAGPTLAMLSACGEIPYGGRSNQFLHNNTFYAAVCEWYAARAAGRGDAATANRFRLAAREAVDAIAPWLRANPVRHVKNLYPRESGLGCEKYAYFEKYMATMGSWAMLAERFSTEGAPAATRCSLATNRTARAPEAYAFATSPDFHFLFLRSGPYSAQFDYGADTHYDCDGLGRLHRRGAPPAIFMSTPCAASPSYATESPNECPLAMAPAGCDAIVPAGHGACGESAWANWKAGESDWHCRLSPDGLSSAISGPGQIAIRLPAFEFDGESAARIDCDSRRLAVSYRGWTCLFETDGTIADTGLICCNRNGRYRVFEARAERRLSVHVDIHRETAR